jgi:hypothetical protein
MGGQKYTCGKECRYWMCCQNSVCICVQIVSKISFYKLNTKVNIWRIFSFIFGLKHENFLFPLHEKVMLYFDFLILKCKTAFPRLMSTSAPITVHCMRSQVDNCHTVFATGLFGKHSYSCALSKRLPGHCNRTTRVLRQGMWGDTEYKSHVWLLIMNETRERNSNCRLDK